MHSKKNKSEFNRTRVNLKFRTDGLCSSRLTAKGVTLLCHLQGLHRLEKYLNIQDCLEKSLKIKFSLKSTGKTLKGLGFYHLQEFSTLSFET